MSCTTEWTWQRSERRHLYFFVQRKTLQRMLSPRRSKWHARKLKGRPDTWALASWVNECETLSVVIEHNGKLIKGGGSYFLIMVWRVGSCIDRDGVIQGEIRPVLTVHAALAPGDSTSHSVSTSIMVEQAALLRFFSKLSKVFALLEHTSGPGETLLIMYSTTLRCCGRWDVGTSPRLQHSAKLRRALFWACTSDKCSPKGEES